MKPFLFVITFSLICLLAFGGNDKTPSDSGTSDTDAFYDPTLIGDDDGDDGDVSDGIIFEDETIYDPTKNETLDKSVDYDLTLCIEKSEKKISTLPNLSINRLIRFINYQQSTARVADKEYKKFLKLLDSNFGKSNLDDIDGNKTLNDLEILNELSKNEASKQGGVYIALDGENFTEKNEAVLAGALHLFSLKNDLEKILKDEKLNSWLEFSKPIVESYRKVLKDRQLSEVEDRSKHVEYYYKAEPLAILKIFMLMKSGGKWHLD